MFIVRLAYERIGSGEPLVLLHGIGHRRQAWGAVLDWLAPHRQLILVDLPGHGDSPPLLAVGRSVPEALIQGITGLLDQLGLDRPNLAGNSLGGRIALETALRGRAASVTAIAPAGFWTNRRELLYAQSVSKVMEAAGKLAEPLRPMLSRTAAGRALIYAAIVSKPSQVTPKQASDDMAAFLAARNAVNAILAAAVPYSGTIPADIPVTIAWGTRDHLLPPRQVLVAMERIPQANIVLLPGCGHVPMTDNPQLVADLLLAASRPSARPARQRATSTLTGCGSFRPRSVPALAERPAGPPRPVSCQRIASRRLLAAAAPYRHECQHGERGAEPVGYRHGGSRRQRGSRCWPSPTVPPERG